jgi:hypothetical protein
MTTGNYQPSWWVAAESMRDHAKRLERERDEAREERDSLQVMRKEVVAANRGARINAQVSNSLAGKLNRAERERDEARGALREAIKFRDTSLSGYDLDGWMKAAGLKEGAK